MPPRRSLRGRQPRKNALAGAAARGITAYIYWNKPLHPAAAATNKTGGKVGAGTGVVGHYAYNIAYQQTVARARAYFAHFFRQAVQLHFRVAHNMPVTANIAVAVRALVKPKALGPGVNQYSVRRRAGNNTGLHRKCAIFRRGAAKGYLDGVKKHIIAGMQHGNTVV